MLDGEQVMRAVPGQVDGMGALGVHRIGGDNRAADLYAIQQRGEHGDLVRLGADLHLAQDGAVSMVKSRQKVTAVLPAVSGTS